MVTKETIKQLKSNIKTAGEPQNCFKIVLQVC